MFMNLSNFIPKSGHEAEFLDYFENNVLPITFAAEGLITADVVVSEDGQITNLERWESKAHWEALVRELTEGEGSQARTETMNSLGQDWWERNCREVRRLKDQDMPTFVYLGNYTASGLEGAMRDGFESRVTAVSDLLEAHGGKLLQMGFCLGEYDFVIVADVPDRKTALIAPMVAGAAGTVSVSTIELISAIEMSEVASMAKSSDFRVAGSGGNQLGRVRAKLLGRGAAKRSVHIQCTSPAHTLHHHPS